MVFNVLMPMFFYHEGMESMEECGRCASAFWGEERELWLGWWSGWWLTGWVAMNCRTSERAAIPV